MADLTSRKVIEYVADTKDVLRKLRQIAKANASLGQRIGKDFAKGAKVAGDSMGKLATTVKPVFNKAGEQVGTATTSLSRFSQAIQGTNGKMIKFTETVKTNAKGAKSVTKSYADMGKNLKDVQIKQSSFYKKSSQLGTDFNNLNNINQKYATSLKNVGMVSNVVARDIPQFSGNMKKVGSVVKTTDGKILHLRETLQRTPAGLQTVSRSVQNVTSSFNKTSKATKQLKSNTVSLGQNMARLAKRALMTIPIWFALRAVMQGTSAIVRNGIKAIAEQDRAFQKAKRNIEATAKSQSDLNKQLANLKKETLDLSLTSGKSITELTNAFQKFATVGFDAEASMAGMQYATKLATVEFGDATETANAFARAMRVMMDTSEGAKSESQQLGEAMALTDQLWKKNAFEIKEFTSNLLKFAGTAKVANLSTQETLTLLATLSTGGLGQSGGRLLTTAIMKSLADLDKVAKELNITLDPTVDSTYTIVTKLIGALGQLNTVEKAPAELLGTLKELFRIRGARIFATFQALESTLKENAKLAPDIAKLDKSFTDVVNTTGVLTQRITNVNSEIGKAFIIGVTGGDDFNDSLKRIVKTLESMREGAEGTGQFLSNLFTFRGVSESEINASVNKMTNVGTEMFDKINKGLKGELDNTELKKLLIDLQTFGAGNLGMDSSTFDASIVALNKLLNIQQDITNERKSQEKIEKKLQKKIESHYVTKEDMEDGIQKIQQKGLLLENNYKEKLQALGLSRIEIEKKVLEFQTQQNLKTSYELGLQKELISHLKSMEDIQLRVAEQKGLIQNQIEALQLQGATNVQLVKMERSLENLYGINQDRNSQLNYELKLQRAITTEQIKQGDLSNTSLKLYKIAKEKDRYSANAIAGFVRGDTPLNAFEMGGKFSNLMSTLKKYFESELTQRQATKYFFEGTGRNIAIPERTAIQDFKPITSIKLPKIETNVGNITIELKQALTREQIANQVLSDLGNALETDDTIKDAIENIIENY